MSHSNTLNTVIKTGNSLAVVVPAKFVKRAGVKPGDKVKVSINLHQGKITYEFINVRQLSLV
jgi:antitoxin component of MazEF toxin-antitoxin module